MSRGRSLAERIAALPPAARAAVLGAGGAEAAISVSQISSLAGAGPGAAHDFIL